MTTNIIKTLVSGILACSICFTQSGCAAKNANADDTNNETESASVEKSFSADSAYAYIARQVDFGPRVPGTQAHRDCADWLIATLRSHRVDTVLEQRTTLTASNGDRLPVCNILARFNPGSSRRVLLLAHWDCRPWADNDADEQWRSKPVDGANDGASGVGVLLEIARNLGEKRPDVGVDILLTDAEDYGDAGNDDSWCLGTQYWLEHSPYDSGNRPMYGILLDMVGGRSARFHREYFSDNYARSITSKVWATAARLGYGDIFIDEPGGAITDDHVYVMSAGIPTVDIIESANEVTGSFPPTWHTHTDNMDYIDTKTLDAVGNTVLNIIYNEK
jgi:hypothetical protein